MSDNTIQARSRSFPAPLAIMETANVPNANRLECLYYAALAANIAWSNALRTKFGCRSGDARYDHRGVSTPELRELKEKKVEADTAWRNALHATREPLKAVRAPAA